MKKLLLTALMVLSLVGCGNTTTVEETANVETETMWVDRVEAKYGSKEYVEQLRDETIATMEENWEAEGIPSEECKDEIVALLQSIEYDSSFEYGYDLDSLQRAYVDILVEYNMLPDACAGLNFDEIEAM